MICWTSKSAQVAGNGFGIARNAGGKTWDLFRFPEAKALKREEVPECLSFIVSEDADGKNVYFGHENKLYRFSFEDTTRPVIVSEDNILDAVRLPDGKLLVSLGRKDSDGKFRAKLVKAKIENQRLILDGTTFIPDAPQKIVWPAGAIWQRGQEPWPEEPQDPEDEDHEPPAPADISQLDVAKIMRSGPVWQKVRLARGPYGITVTSNYSGMIAVIDPETLKTRMCVRVPTQPDVNLSAVATPEGVLVTSSVSFRESALLHIASNGTVIRSWFRFGMQPAYGLSSAILFAEDAAIVSQCFRDYECYLVDLTSQVPEKIEIMEQCRISGEPAYSDDFQHVVFPLSEKLEVSKIGLIKREERTPSPKIMKIQNFRQTARSSAFLGPEEIVAPPKLGLATAIATPRWELKANEDTRLDFIVTNLGGAVTGLYVHADGDALKNGLIKFTKFESGLEQATFEDAPTSTRAELPHVTVNAAKEDRNPKTKVAKLLPTTINISITIKGLRPGDGLLMIRVGPLEGSAGSALQGKSVAVR